ncbi:unnamed protein product [Toxocara canis]|uniref:MENTAL domain-containing protein n=1 Tax=Toxocara canis TaxID=6265 RepID=A0A183V4W1_TOXCA|nr:unnamed protein product [Toxocara canis]
MVAGLVPMPPPRPDAQRRATWRESLAVLLCMVLCVMVLISVCCLGTYLLKDKPLYEELVDYLDKTIAISKINYNHQLGIYELSEKELSALADQRMYKTLLWTFFFADLGCYLFLAIAILMYFTIDISVGRAFIIFWVVFGIAFVYCIAEIHIFSFLMFPYSSLLPNVTEKLLNHAIPYNPGGLSQMEQRLGCSFDLNLYAAQRRRQNPMNTCDPQISSSFLSKALLWTLMLLRLFPVVIFVMLIAHKFAISSAIASLVDRMKTLLRHNETKNRYIKKKDYRKNNYKVDISNTKTTVIGAPPAPGTRLAFIC